MRGGPFLPIFIAYLSPMFLIMLIVYGSTIQVVAWKPLVLWTDQFGDPSLSSGVQGLAYLNGSIYTSGTLNYDSRNLTTIGRWFLRVYRSDGSMVWMNQIESLGGAVRSGLSVASDRIFLMGTSSVNSSLRCYDSKGNQLWSKPMGPGISETSLSAWGQLVYVAGFSNHTLTNQTLTGSKFAFVREYDLDGSVVWTNEFSNSSTVISNPLGVQGMYASSSGVYVLIGDSLFAFSLNGQQVWSRQFDGSGLANPYVISADSTGVYVSGTFVDYLFPSGLFLDKFTLDGRTAWNDTFDSPSRMGTAPFSLSTGPSGVYLTDEDYLLRYDSVGNQVWSYRLPDEYGGGGSGFLVASGQTGPYLARSTGQVGSSTALVQSLSSSNSLFFFEVSPPWSFALIASAFIGLTLIVYLLRRRHRRIVSKRPKSSLSHRFRIPGDTPG